MKYGYSLDGPVDTKAQLQMWIARVKQCVVAAVYQGKISGKIKMTLVPRREAFWAQHEQRFLDFFDGVLEKTVTGKLQMNDKANKTTNAKVIFKYLSTGSHEEVKSEVTGARREQKRRQLLSVRPPQQNRPLFDRASSTKTEETDTCNSGGNLSSIVDLHL
jgi:hypothetical protein